MSKYDPKPKVDTPLDQLNRDLVRADKEVRRQLEELVKMQEIFWCAPVTHGDDAKTRDEIQAKIDADPAAAQLLLTGSKESLEFHVANHPDEVAEIVPDRCLGDGAYSWIAPMNVGDPPLVLGTLKPEWDLPKED